MAELHADVVVLGAGMVGAVLIAPWLVGWYVRRMDPFG